MNNILNMGSKNKMAHEKSVKAAQQLLELEEMQTALAVKYGEVVSTATDAAKEAGVSNYRQNSALAHINKAARNHQKAMDSTKMFHDAATRAAQDHGEGDIVAAGPGDKDDP